MSSRKTHLTEEEIANFERMTPSEVATYFFKAGNNTSAELFYALLRSYRIAAAVANCAWKLVKYAESTGTLSPEVFTELQRSLSAYSTGNFSPSVTDADYTCRRFEELYDRLARMNDSGLGVAALMETIYQDTAALRAFIEQASRT